MASLSLPGAALSRSYEVLHAFTLDGAYPESTLIQATDGSFYGTTPGGGANSQGTVFKMDSSGNLTTLYSFTGGDGANPYAGLIQATDGNFYGTTYLGGANNDGSVFKVDSAGNLITLHSFTGSDGANPYAGLIQASDGNFYGTTAYGGVNNYGTVFKMDSSGNLTTLHTFLGIDGSGPSGALVQATDGNFYGTAYFGGASGWGTVFKMNSAGNLTVLYNFDYEDGAGPASALIQATDGNFYGTAYFAGASGEGTVFKMNSAGNLTVLYSFGHNDGANPSGALIQATDGNFYGTAYRGGANNYGIVFKMDSAGHVRPLHTFAGSDGSNPVAALIQAGDGNFYGMTSSGGAGGNGVVFRWACLMPAISVAACLPANSPGLTASVPGNPGDTYNWTISGGTIDSGQGTNSVSFTSGGSGTLIDLGIVQTTSSGCSGGASQTLQVDFADEPPSDTFYSYVCAIGHDEVTAGCGGGNYCPGDPVTRAQMAVFLLRGEYGSGFLPLHCTGIFNDVACPGAFAADWIEQLYREGITGGCATNPLKYCPDSPVTRAQMAVFLLRAEHGSGYTPPTCHGIFGDVACPGGFAVDWIEQLHSESIAAGCQASPPLYCPDNPNTRGQMAVFLTTTFSLQ